MDNNTLNNTDTTGKDDMPIIENETTTDNCSSTTQEQDNEANSDNIINAILEKMGVSSSTATAARAIIDTMKSAQSPNENVIKLIVNALRHDEDMKNAEAAGYIRGRNEVIDEACNSNTCQEPKNVNFPIYRKRSFWD